MLGLNRGKDKVVFLKNYGNYYQVVGIKHISPKGETLRFKSRTFKPKSASYQLSNGRSVYYLDLVTGQCIPLGKNKTVPKLTTSELDILLSNSFIKGFVRVFGGAIKQDWFIYLMLAIMFLLLGLVIGIVVE